MGDTIQSGNKPEAFRLQHISSFANEITWQLSGWLEQINISILTTVKSYISGMRTIYGV